jgi:hypothetical protein
LSTSPRFPNLPDTRTPESTQTAQPNRAGTTTRDALETLLHSVIRTPFHAAATGVGARTARRHIAPQAGFALEALGHAIEYLADEYVHAAGSIPSIHSSDPRLQAIQMLMAANREVYYSCPVLPSFWQRLRRRFFGDQ